MTGSTKKINLDKLDIDFSKIQIEPELTKKELAAQKRQQAKERSVFISRLVTALSLGIVLGVILFFVKDEKLAIAGGGGVTVLMISYQYPYLAMWLFIIYMPFAGTITYWIGGGNALFQLAKDGFAIPASIAIYQEVKKKRLPYLIPANMQLPFKILLIFCLLTFLSANVADQFSGNPKGKPVLMAVLGLKALIGYLPLIPCTYHLIKTKVHLIWMVRLHIILAIVCCSLGVLQYQMLSSGACQGTDHLVGDALFKATLEYKCLVGGSLVFSPSQNMIRLPGTFVAPWQWAWFLIGNTFTTFAGAFSDPSILWKLISFLGLALVFINSVISGQRIALFLVPVIVIILLILTGQVSKPKTFIPIVGGIAALITLSFILFPEVIQERIDSAVGRWNASPPTEFISEQAGHSTGSFRPFGYGLGRATNAARAFGEGALIETYYPKLIYEMGFGTIGFLLVVSAITSATFKAYRSVKDKDLRSYGASFWVLVLFLSYQTYYYPLDVDPMTVYYWMFAGLILKIPEIEKQENEKLQLAKEKAIELIKAGYLKPKRKK